MDARAMMAGRVSKQPRRALVAAWLATSLASATYLAVILQFELRGVLLGLFVGVSGAVLAYWLGGEPGDPPD